MLELRRLVAICLLLSMTAAAQTWERDPRPSGMFDAAMVAVPTSGQVLLWGGLAAWTEHRVWAYDAAGQWQIGPVVRPPAGPLTRTTHAMALDPLRNRVVLFGGVRDATTWEYDPGAGTWAQPVLGSEPTARVGHAMVFDVVLGKVLMFGGQDRNGRWLNDTWTYDGSWRQVTTANAPVARSEHAMVYDTGLGGPLLFGGRDGTTTYGDTWTYDSANAAWRRLPIAPSPGSRAEHAMAHDPVRGQTVLFGGIDNAGPLGDTWVFAGGTATWNLVAPAHAPSPRDSHSMAYHPARGCVVLTGGAAASDTWEFDGVTADWVRTDFGPPPRSAALLAYDGPRGRLLVHGGRVGSSTLSDTWAFDAETRAWSLLSTAGPVPVRDESAMTFDDRTGKAILFGGGVSMYLQDTWEFDGTSWSLATPPTSPIGRLEHSMVMDRATGRAVMFGGFDVQGGAPVWLTDTWEYDPVRSTWTQTFSTGPRARIETLMTFDTVRARVILFGGREVPSGNRLNDMWEYHTAAGWRQVATTGAPPAGSHVGMFDEASGDLLVRSLGGGSSAWWAWDSARAAWRQIGLGPPSGNEVSYGYDRERGRPVAFGAFTLLGPSDMLWTRRHDNASWVAYGTGCAGSNGTPALGVANSTTPALGSTLQLQATNLPLTPGTVGLLIGFDLGRTGFGAPLPLGLAPVMPGCLLWIDNEAAWTATHGGGQHTFDVSIPNQPALSGALFGTQAVVFDPQAANGLAALSNAGVGVVR